MDLSLTMGLPTSDIKSIIELNMEIMNLPLDTIISMELKTSGACAKSDFPDSVECIKICFICILKSANLDITIETKIYT
jgi:hypothetical protein